MEILGSPAHHVRSLKLSAFQNPDRCGRHFTTNRTHFLARTKSSHSHGSHGVNKKQRSPWTPWIYRGPLVKRIHAFQLGLHHNLGVAHLYLRKGNRLLLKGTSFGGPNNGNVRKLKPRRGFCLFFKAHIIFCMDFVNLSSHHHFASFIFIWSFIPSNGRRSWQAVTVCSLFFQYRKPGDINKYS